MSTNPDLRSLDLDTLILRCRAESRQASDVQHLGQQTPCYELFRRAIEEQHQEAWEFIYDQYRRLVLFWIGPHLPDVDALVNQAFAKFWRFCSHDTFSHRFPDLKCVFGYLQRCAITARQEAQRQQQRLDRFISGGLVTASAHSSSVEAVALENVTLQECKASILSRLKDDREQRVIYLSYDVGLTPLQISQGFPDEFPSAHEVSRIKERVLKRLRYDPSLRSQWEKSKSENGW